MFGSMLHARALAAREAEEKKIDTSSLSIGR